MSKKITITLSEKAEKYFNEVMYALTDENDKPCSQSMAINNSLESLAEFEDETANQLWNWLSDFKKLNPDAQEFAGNPTLYNQTKIKNV